MNNKIIYIIYLMIFPSLVSIAQQWEPMDLGFTQTGNLYGVEKIKYNPIDGQIYVGGYIYNDGRDRLIKGFSMWNNVTQLWDTIYNTTFDFGHDFGFYNNEIYYNGFRTQESFLEDGNFHVWNNDSWVYNSMGPADAVFNSRIIDGDLYMVGSFERVGSEPSFGIARYDGQEFHSYYSDLVSEINSFRLDDIIKYKDDIYVVGKNLYGPPYYDWNGFAKMGETNLEVAHEEFTGSFFWMWVYALEEFQGDLYIGGLFHKDQGFSGNGILRFDGTNMHEVGGGVNLRIYDMKVYKGELYVVGSFGRIGEETIWGDLYTGTPCSGVAKWDGETWTCLLEDNTVFGQIRTLEIYQDTLYVGGGFSSLLGDTAMSLIARRKITPKPGITTLDELTLYPNPTNNQLHFDFGNLLDIDAKVKIYNPIGQIVKEITIPAWEQTYILNTSPLSRGVYIVKVQLGKAIQTKKIIIQ